MTCPKKSIQLYEGISPVNTFPVSPPPFFTPIKAVVSKEVATGHNEAGG